MTAFDPAASIEKADAIHLEVCYVHSWRGRKGEDWQPTEGLYFGESAADDMELYLELRPTKEAWGLNKPILCDYLIESGRVQRWSKPDHPPGEGGASIRGKAGSQGRRITGSSRPARIVVGCSGAQDRRVGQHVSDRKLTTRHRPTFGCINHLRHCVNTDIFREWHVALQQPCRKVALAAPGVENHAILKSRQIDRHVKPQHLRVAVGPEGSLKAGPKPLHSLAVRLQVSFVGLITHGQR